MAPLRTVVAAVTATLLLALLPAGAATAAPAGPPPRPAAGPGPDTSLTTHAYGYADAPLGQPLKGFAPYLFPGDNLSTKYPGGLVWSYFALNEVMQDPASCAVFDWSVFDKALDEAAVWGRQVAFRFYLEYPGGSGTHPGNGIPPCLNGKAALRTNGFWGTVSPDYDDPDVIAAITSFITAFAQRYDRAGPGGTADPRIGFMSLGLVGLWGEWHTWPYDRDTADGYPDLMPTDATIRTIIGAYDAAFANIQLEVRYPLAGTETANIGFHDDSWPYKEWRGGQLKGMTLPVSMNGWDDAFLQLQLNTGTENRWVTQSIGGEARPEIQGSLYANWPGGSGQVDDVLAATELTHITWMINQTGAGGYSTSDPKVAAGVRAMGYNLHIPQANFNATAAGTFKVGVTMQNTGVAPFYYPWTTVIGLRDAAGTVVKTWDTSWDLRQVQPLKIRAFPDWGAGPAYLDYGRPVNFAATLSTAGVPAGQYRLVLKVRNPLEAVTPQVLRARPAASRLTDWVIDQWRPALPLSFANTNQGADGWVDLGPLSTTGTCSGDCSAPSVPAGLAVGGVTNTSVALSWSPSTDNVGVTGYQVFRDGARVGTVAGTSFTDTGRSPGQTYQYTVRAVDAAGNVSGPSAAVTATTTGCAGDCTAPSAPGGVSASGVTNTSVSLSWSPSTDNVGVTGYEVFRGGVLVGAPTGTSYTDTGLTASTAYSYTVKARDAAGNRSPASNAVSVTTSAAPAGLVLDDFDGSPAYPSAALNDLGKWTGGNCFLDGGGSGVVSGGALSLRYSNCGWFGSDVNTDLSSRSYLVVRVKGAAGGEQAHFNLSLGGTTKVFGDLTLDGGAHPVITTSFQDIRIPLTSNGISRTAPGQLAMGFWYGGTSTITIDSITFQ
ncbi:fibronectin type III domain-containing protein [Dactylosporangium aurantiacum]|uniref:fibronectin type III domain-containing protein n=1 Tax=Dactylosporangium aurantiacum TaxID=35754 RepID=UPI0006944A9C|nr:fibronectin type III domain-containing protein [Dactylosporangium aurantiacum]MDG6101877.1 fibronectin type III domain-containing protein [Dactylosporangium aurantiacum]